jgi:ATP-dependent protease ClpP protease subunit
MKFQRIGADHVGMAIIHLYDEVRPGDAAKFVQQLGDPGQPVELHINSPGGSVPDGLAMYNALRGRQTTIYIDGLAASIASLIAMAGQRILIAENALIMVHWPWSMAEGNASAMRKMADTLDQFGKAMLGAYARTGLAEAELARLLEAETWMDAAEALRLGFADEMAPALSAVARFDLSRFNFKHTPLEAHMPIHAASQPATQTSTQSPTQTQPNTANPGEPNPQPSQPAAPQVSQATADAVNELHDLVAFALELQGGESPEVRAICSAALRTPGVSAADVRAQILRARGAAASPLAMPLGFRDVPGRAEYVNDFREAASDALAIRAGVTVSKPHAGAAEFRAAGVADIARACLSRAGQAHQGMTSAALIQAAMSVGDFPAILSNTLGKALRAGFESEPASHRGWVRTSHVADFKEQSRVILGSAPGLDKVPEGGEYQNGAFDEDASVPFAIETYGKIVQFTRQALVNDDLGAFTKITQAAGQAASRAEADLVYGLLAGAGQVMQDNKTLFHADHANLATAAVALDAGALGAARTLLRRQLAVGGGVLNLQPRFLLVAPEQEQDAEILLASSAQRINQGSDQRLAAPWLSSLTLVTDSRLDGSAFYLLAGSEQIDVFELAYLEGQTGPEIEQQEEFRVDATSMKVRHDFGGRFLDWRGIVKVPLS